MFDANPQGQLVDVTVDNRDGSYSKEYFDAQLLGDPETQLDYVNADGSWKAFLYDPGNTQRWSSAVQYFSAAGQEISATFTLRTGGTEDQVYDQAHGDALQTDTTYNPDGTVNQWVYDTAGVNGWYKYLYNAAGTVRLSQAYYDRNGNIEVLAWDPAHGDALQTDTTYASTGTHQVMYDTAGVNGWSALISDWNASGQLVDQSWGERDGASNTDFYSNGVLTTNVTIGVGGEKAEATYNSTLSSSSVTTVTDEQGRQVFADYLNRDGSTNFLSIGNGWAEIQKTWLDTYVDKYGNIVPVPGNLSSLTVLSSGGNTEQRLTDPAGHLAGVNDRFADGTSDITLLATPEDHVGAAADTLTATFDASGNLRNIVESTTQGGSQNFVTISASMLQKSLGTPGTLTFIEHGLEVLLVNPGTGNTPGTATSEIFWQAISGGQASATAGGVRPDSLVGTMHYVGAAAGAISGGLVGAVGGVGLGVKASGPFAETPFGIGAAIVGGVAGGITGALAGWVKGGHDGTLVGQDIQNLLGSGPVDPPAPAVSDFGTLGHI